MNESARHDIEQRLSRISTQWSVVFDAHARRKSASSARAEVLHRYRGAVFRYLLGATRDPQIAEELCQDFAVKVLEGQLHRADPDRGRFRDYVKRTLINLVNAHYRRQAKSPGGLPQDVEDRLGPDKDAMAETEFVRQWRDEIMNQTWEALHRDRPAVYTLLKLRLEEPELTSRQLAAFHVERYGGSMTAANVRKTLQRAHDRFADLLLSEVTRQLDEPTRESLQRELEELELAQHCRDALQRWTPH